MRPGRVCANHTRRSCCKLNRGAATVESTASLLLLSCASCRWRACTRRVCIYAGLLDDWQSDPVSTWRPCSMCNWSYSLSILGSCCPSSVSSPTGSSALQSNTIYIYIAIQSITALHWQLIDWISLTLLLFFKWSCSFIFTSILGSISSRKQAEEGESCRRTVGLFTAVTHAVHWCL